MVIAAQSTVAGVARRTVLRASGHTHIRGTHGQTLELTTESAISPRATCVLGVDLSFDPVAAALLRGPVRLEVSAAGRSACGTAVINPGHEVRDRVVVRRAPAGGPETLAVSSTLTAADLDRELLSALAEPGTPVTLTVTEDGSRRPLVLVGAPGMSGPAGRLGLLWRHADTVVRGLARATLGGGGTVVAVISESTVDVPWLAEAASHGARFAIVTGAAPAAEALLAAGLPASPALWLGRVDRRAARDPRFADPVRPAAVPTVLAVPVSDVDGVLGPLAAADPEHPVAVQADPYDVGTAMDWTTAAGAVRAVRAHPGADALVVLAAQPPGGDLAAAGRALVAAGVPARTVSDALAPLGLDRRTLYGGLRERRSGAPDRR